MARLLTLKLAPAWPTLGRELIVKHRAGQHNAPATNLSRPTACVRTVIKEIATPCATQKLPCGGNKTAEWHLAKPSPAAAPQRTYSQHPLARGATYKYSLHQPEVGTPELSPTALQECTLQHFSNQRMAACSCRCLETSAHFLRAPRHGKAPIRISRLPMLRSRSSWRFSAPV